MRSNAPHWVHTVSHCICHGGHYYCISMIKDTLFGIIHALIADSYITNTSHENMRSMIWRMVIFVYRALVDQELDDDGNILYAFVQ
jgi:hypothetical protein